MKYVKNTQVRLQRKQKRDVIIQTKFQDPRIYIVQIKCIYIYKNNNKIWLWIRRGKRRI